MGKYDSVHTVAIPLVLEFLEDTNENLQPQPYVCRASTLCGAAVEALIRSGYFDLLERRSLIN